MTYPLKSLFLKRGEIFSAVNENKGVIIMKRHIKTASLFLITAAIITAGCANPFRTKSRCEILCEQMHSECNVNCPRENYDPACYERCDNLSNCRDRCDKPIFKEGDEENKEE